MCRSRRELSNEYLLAKLGVDTAENELLEVLFNIIQYYSFVSLGTACSNKALVEEIAAELQARKIGRGNVAQVREAEVMKEQVALLHTKVDLIMAHLNIDMPPPVQKMAGAPGKFDPETGARLS